MGRTFSNSHRPIQQSSHILGKSLIPKIVIDWDGTVTEEDTLSSALRHFVPAATLDPLTARVDTALAEGRMTLQEVMDAEFSAMNAPVAAVADYIVEHARVRPGFADFVKAFNPLILSTSFHETIEPILAREGVTATVRAGHVTATSEGWSIRWMSTEVCSHCGERCKRSLLPPGDVIYVGDGYSDRCAALAATRVFARDGLARYLDDLAIAYEPFADFHDITKAVLFP
jgi:2-hydroxy-3-keto-5-methylthiopentenyl-1-phosphate phosphatase